MTNRTAEIHDRNNVVFGYFFVKCGLDLGGRRCQGLNPGTDRCQHLVRKMRLSWRHLSVPNHLIELALIRLAGNDHRTGFAALHHAIERAEIHFFDTGVGAVTDRALCH